MFEYSNFNYPIGSWDVSQVTDMSEMFYHSPFNQNISGWDVSSVAYMSEMFYDSSFNQNISGWDVSQVTDMRGMFYDSPFNQPIGDWDVSQVIDMNSMFSSSQFNYPIGGWGVSHVTDMNSMFSSSQFNQNISEWVVSQVIDMDNMLSNSALDISNYDALLIGWNRLESFSTLQVGADGLHYCYGASAHEALANKNLTFIGDTPRCYQLTAEISDLNLTSQQFTVTNTGDETVEIMPSENYTCNPEQLAPEAAATCNYTAITNFQVTIRGLSSGYNENILVNLAASPVGDSNTTQLCLFAGALVTSGFCPCVNCLKELNLLKLNDYFGDNGCYCDRI
jgi:surface protein